jgi:hypothetical protein
MSEYVPSASRPAARFWGVAALLLVVLVALGAYGFHQHSLAGRLAIQNSEMSASLNATRSQIEALTAKLDALSAPPSQKPAATHLASVPTRTRRPANQRARAEDSRWRKVQAQLAEHGKQIESTRQDLANTRTELQGSIARTHDDLVLLQKRGERSYYEFDLDKSGQFQRQGPVGIRLRKANTKHEYADLELMVDDFKLSKKHVNIYEPVTFYNADHGRPVELVINNISKNHIHGYVSEPKYKSSDLDAMTANLSTGTAGTNGEGASGVSTSTSPSPPRQRLQLPKSDGANPN